jgi:hypothetical protein
MKDEKIILHADGNNRRSRSSNKSVMEETPPGGSWFQGGNRG